MEKIKKKTWRGSFTIEVAYLMPVVCFLIWNILYLAFFLYNQSTILQGSYCSGLRAERIADSEEEKWNILEEKFDREVNQKVVYGKIQTEKTVEKEEITVETKLEMKAPAGLFFFSDWKGETRQTVKKYSPVAFIRNCRKADNILTIIKDRK